MMKVEMGAKAAPSTIFTSATDPAYGLMTFTGVVYCHFTEYGMDAIFYFPTHDGTLVNILQGHSQFTREEISKQSLELYNNRDDTTKTLPLERYDMYDLQRIEDSLQPSSWHPSLQLFVIKCQQKLAKTTATDPSSGCM